MADGEKMITLREVVLEFEPELIEGVLITGLWLEEQEEARSLIQNTEAYCEQRIHETQQAINEMEENAKAEHKKRLAEMLEELEANFLDKSEALFAEWHQAREREVDEITERARQLVESVFIKILDQLTDEDKFHAVFKQFVRVSDPRTEATLYFHTQQSDTIKEWLSQHHQLMWTLSPDDTLTPDELVLRTAKGELSLSWPGFQKHLVSRLM